MIFETRLNDDDISVLTTGKMYDGIKTEWFETRRSLAILEIGYLDIELNICETDAEGKELEGAYYICKRYGENACDWEGVGYADEVFHLANALQMWIGLATIFISFTKIWNVF